MELEQILNDSFVYAKKMFTDAGRLIILIVLNIIPIVNLVVAGYLGRVVKESPSSSEPSKLTGYVDLFILGLKVAVAIFIYMLIPTILLVLGAFSILMPFMPWGMPFDRMPFMPMILPSALGLLIVIVAAVLIFFITIIMAIAIVHMIKANSFGKAFAVGEVLSIINKIGWGKYILWLIIMLVCALVVGALGRIPVVGWLFSAIISPVFGVFMGRSAALIYTEGKIDK